MVESKQKSFLFGTDISAGAAPKRRFAFYLWNYGLLSLSAAGICVITLQLAIGVYTSEIFSDYFSHPLILLLNFLPILLLTFLAYAATNRAWAAFLITSAVFVTAAVGNFYKLKFRNDPFSLLGWDGSAYMKLTNSYRDELPVVNSNGFYLDNGEVATELSDGLSDKKDQFDCIQYYIRKHFYYSEVAS